MNISRTTSETGPCGGYVIDHIMPLTWGGADEPSNMQWQITLDAKAKDRLELKIHRHAFRNESYGLLAKTRFWI
jgi:hypothetical protein